MDILTLADNMAFIRLARGHAPASIIDKVAYVLPSFGTFQPQVLWDPDSEGMMLKFEDEDGSMISILVYDEPKAHVMFKTVKNGKTEWKRELIEPSRLASVVRNFFKEDQ